MKVEEGFVVIKNSDLLVRYDSAEIQLQLFRLRLVQIQSKILRLDPKIQSGFKLSQKFQLEGLVWTETGVSGRIFRLGSVRYLNSAVWFTLNYSRDIRVPINSQRIGWYYEHLMLNIVRT